jgi:probable aminopeptidase NPEPL1
MSSGRYTGKALRVAASRIRLNRMGVMSESGHTVLIGAGTRNIVPQELGRLDSLWKEGGDVYHNDQRVTVIPASSERVSRHNCPSRPDLIAKRLLDISSKATGSVSVTAVVKNASDVLAASNAIHRAFPIVSFKSKRTEEVDISFGIGIERGDSVDGISSEQARELSVIGSNIRLAQALTDLPPNELDPDSFTQIVSDIVSELPGVEIRIFDDCEGAGLMGIHTVGKAAMHKPRMIILTHDGTGDADTVSIVGKGITYDTGGLSLKTNMKGMKRDMGGAAAAFGAFLALAELQHASKLHCVLCIAENAIGPHAYRNDDIVTLYSGKSVEINNTDAEGRLLLADGVSYAAKDLKSDLIIDIATLTGAAAVASGRMHASFVTTLDELAKDIIAAGKSSGDLAHEIVFCPEFHRNVLKSTIADMKNSVTSPSPDAPSSAAATFIFDHLTASGYTKQWAHIDMASVVDYLGERSTGYGVGLLVEVIRSRDIGKSE